jgi:hypothetical protein
MGSESWEVRITMVTLRARGEHSCKSLAHVQQISQTMMQAHGTIAVVGRWVYEVAEMYLTTLSERNRL